MSTILITGASSGIGKATALMFAEKGWTVIAAARDFAKAPEITGNSSITTVKLDMADPAQIRAVAAEVLDQFDVDVLYNNAGHMLIGPVELITDEQLEYEIAVDLLGPIRLSQAFIPAFRKRGAGLIINTTSLVAIASGPFMTVYAAAKAGLERWSFGLNLELNPFGIRVKTIIPGIANTNVMNHGTLVSGEPYKAHGDKIFAAFQSPQLQSQVSDPAEIAAVVFEAATDGTDRIRYLADKIAKDSVSMMSGLGEETVMFVGAKNMFG